MIHKHGNKARALINDKLAEARGTAEQTPALRPEGAKELEVQFDGGMIPVATREPIEVPEGEEPELTPVRGLPKRRRAYGTCLCTQHQDVCVQKPFAMDGNRGTESCVCQHGSVGVVGEDPTDATPHSTSPFHE